jgi:hypothetical protein
MTDTQLRFLRSIAERLPLDRVVELYLFPPMRQGILETGIAIIAAERTLPEAPLAIAPSEEPVAEERGYADGDADGDAIGEACDPTEDASRDDEASSADEASADVVETSTGFDVPTAAEMVAASNAARVASRHTVFTARYRLTLKGPERGRWELSVVEEADAPLLTIEMVVRGVQRRTGDGAEPERMEPTALRELLQAPAA